ncbi:MAG: hypothetical protein ACM3PS_15670 [Syntrophothermus sp.]
MADVTPSVLANSIMGKLYDILTNGDATVPKSADNFFSWATPGIPLGADDLRFLTQGFTGVVTPAAVQTLLAAEGASQPSAAGAAGATTPAPKLTEADLEKLRAQDTAGLYQQAEFFARLVDVVLDVAAINNEHFAKLAVMNNEGGLSEVYETVLKHSQVAHQELTDDEKQKLEHLRSLLTATTEKTDLITGEKKQVTGPSPLVQAYNDKMAAYDAAALEYNSHRIDALAADNAKAVSFWAINANILRDKVQAAMNDWITNGYKNEYEEIAAYIAQVEGRDLVLLKQSYIDELERAKLTGLASGSDYYYTALTPPHFAESTAGWTNFSFSSGDFSRYSNSKYDASGWNASAGGGWLGIFGGSGGGSGSSSRQEWTSGFNSDHCSMSFSIVQIPIVRPWFRPSYLTSPIWRFAVGDVLVKDWKLSDGGKPPTGQLPAYPTSMIFIRDLNLNFGSESGFSEWMNEQSESAAHGGGALSIGPFFLGGSYSSSSKQGRSESSSQYKYDENGMSVPGMQLIGFKAHVHTLPMPNPSSAVLEWV